MNRKITIWINSEVFDYKKWRETKLIDTVNVSYGHERKKKRVNG